MDDEKKSYLDPERPHTKKKPIISYRPITCPSIMWKIPNVLIRGVYYSLAFHRLFPEKQNGFWKGMNRPAHPQISQNKVKKM